MSDRTTVEELLYKCTYIEQMKSIHQTNIVFVDDIDLRIYDYNYAIISEFEHIVCIMVKVEDVLYIYTTCKRPRKEG